MPNDRCQREMALGPVVLRPRNKALGTSLVCKLYGLTEEEIAIVEGRA